jgi:hypothetical protein
VQRSPECLLCQQRTPQEGAAPKSGSERDCPEENLDVALDQALARLGNE